MKNLKICLALAAMLAALAAQGRPPEAPRTAAVSLASRSIRLGEAAGASTLSVMFGTAGGHFTGNGELRPSMSRPGFYEAAYAVFDSSGSLLHRVEVGTIFLAIPAADADADTVPDTADFDSAVNLTLTGEAVPSAASAATRVTQGTFSLQLQRAAGNASGMFITDLIQAVPLGGEYGVLHAEGTVDYRRTDTGALLDFSVSNAITNGFGASRILDTNTVRIGAFRLRTSDARRVRVGPATLVREGNVYRGEVVFSDGAADTAGSDFRSWCLQITDANDANANGVPEFSDVLAPYIAVQPRRHIAPIGETATLSVVVTGAGPFTFEWQQNGHGIANPAANSNERILVLPNTTEADKGSYRVRVSNASGSVFSESTSVSFR
jgi:hypothetical protein